MGAFGKILLRYSALHGNWIAKVAGIALQFIIGPICDGVSYAFAPQSVIAPFAGLSLVWNTALAPLLLGEVLTINRLVGCAIITAAVVGFAFLNLGREEPAFSMAFLEHQLYRPRVAAYAVSFGAWSYINVRFLMSRPSGDRIRGLSLGMMGGSIAGNMFCLKAAVELVETSVTTGLVEIWLHPLTYLMISGAAGFGICNAGFLAAGIEEYEALFMAAAFIGSNVVGNWVSAAVVLGDFDNLPPEELILHVGLLLGVVFGIYVLVQGEDRADTGKKSVH